MLCWPQSFCVNSIILQADLTRYIYIFIYIYMSNMFLSSTNLSRWLFFSPLLSFKGRWFLFPCYLAWTAYDRGYPCCLYYHGGLLGVWCFNFFIFQSTRHSPTCKHRGVINALNSVSIVIDILVFVGNYI